MHSQFALDGESEAVMDIDAAVRLSARLAPESGASGVPVVDIEGAVRLINAIDGRVPGVGRHHPALQRARILCRIRKRELFYKRPLLHVHANKNRATRSDDILSLDVVAGDKRSCGGSSISTASEVQVQHRHYMCFEPRSYISAACCEPWEAPSAVAKRYVFVADGTQDERVASSRFITDAKYAVADLVHGHIDEFCESVFRHWIEIMKWRFFSCFIRL